MPEQVRNSQRYLPGLDGLRALAVGAVVAYHVHVGWAQGGLLGVGVFFTLSGYLITDLLLGQQERTGHLQLTDFWLRRARRLLPALFVMLAVVVAWVTLLDRSMLPAIRGAVAASAVYVTNWWLIAQHNSYFAQFGPPSPLGHLWSLPARTRCSAVVHIGDSTSDGLISPDYLPDARQRIAAQYARVGVTTFIPDVAVGSTFSLAYRIKEMMSLIGSEPVMWVNVKSPLDYGPYAESNMLLWNQALIRACASYPNMRVYDWAAAVKDSWYITDGIHYTSAGYAARAHLIAQALARAFPATGSEYATGQPAGCLVR